MIEAPPLRSMLASVGFAAVFGLIGIGAAARPVSATALAREPIVDAHIHLYQVSRPGGVPWPKAQNKTLYRDMTPDEYKRQAEQHGIIAAGVIEASPLFADNAKLLDMIKGDDFFSFVVAQLEVGSADFSKNLETLAQDRRVVGVRAFDWNQKLTLDAKQIEHLKELAARGMTLDVISRGNVNPPQKIGEMADLVPELRIIVDHLAGAKGEVPKDAWMEDMRKLAMHRNVYIKLSSLFDMFNPGGNEDQPWQTPRTVGAYKEHLDWLMGVFGSERVIFGSNWPVVDLGGGLAAEIQLAETYFEPFGKKIRNKVMYQNAQQFYRRVIPRRQEIAEAKPSKKSARAPDRASDRSRDRDGDRRRESDKRRNARHLQR
jgi:L-fuconolactonase